MESLPATLHKSERLCSKKLISALFQGSRSASVSAYPLRAVFMRLDSEDTNGDEPLFTLPYMDSCRTAMLISVPKHYFKRAVKRNRIKRLVREAYRKHKALVAALPVAIAFIWTGNKMPQADQVERAVEGLLQRIHEKLHA